MLANLYLFVTFRHFKSIFKSKFLMSICFWHKSDHTSSSFFVGHTLFMLVFWHVIICWTNMWLCRFFTFTNSGWLSSHWKHFPHFFIHIPACSLILVWYICKYTRQNLETIRHIAKASEAEASPAKLFLLLITVKHLNSTTDGLAC